MPGSSVMPPSQHLSPSQLTLESVVPPSTHLSGNLTVVWKGILRHDDPIPSVAFCIKTMFPLDLAPRTDYGLASVSKWGTTFIFKIVLRLSEPRATEEVRSREEIVQRLSKDQAELLKLNGKQITIGCEGMRVAALGEEKNVNVITLVSDGERWLRTGNGDVVRVLAPPEPPTGPPSWFTDPSPTPVRPTTPSFAVLQPEPAGPSRLRPLTSHFVPPLADEVISSRKRELPAQKTKPAEKRPPLVEKEEVTIKRARLEPSSEASIDDRHDNPTHQEAPVTVIHLGPSRVTSIPVKLPAPRPIPPAQRSASSSSTVFSSDGSVATKETTPELRLPKESTPELPNAQVPISQLPLSKSEGTLAQSQTRIARRRVSEIELRAQRRQEAEPRAKREADQQRQRLKAEAEKAACDLDTLKRGFAVADVSYNMLGDIAKSTIDHHTYVSSFVAVVKDYHTPKHFRDWTITLVLTDPSIYTSDRGSEDILVTVFRKHLEDLPTDLAPGTPVLFRNVKFTIFNHKAKGQAFAPIGNIAENTWAVLQGKKVKLACVSHMVPALSDQEMRRMVDLKKWWTDVTGSGDANYVDGGNRRESGASELESGKQGLKTLGEIRDHWFFDCVFKILQVVRNERGKVQLELYITDGTTNPSLSRNYHGVTGDLPPNSVFALAVASKPSELEQPLFQEGHYLKMNNIRCKSYQGQLELMWAELVNSEQQAAGWNRRRCAEVGKEDERAKTIEARIRAFKQGQEPGTSAIAQTTPRKPVGYPVGTAIDTNGLHPAKTGVPETVPVATHLATIYRDEIDYAFSTIPAMLANRTYPNRFRIRARVKGLHSRAGGGEQFLAQRHCRHCKRQFTTPYCQSCNDTGLLKAEWRYRFIATLEDENGAEVPVVIGDNEALTCAQLVAASRRKPLLTEQQEDFLPALPPLSSSTNPNDTHKTNTRIREPSARCHDILLGAKMDGQRPRPVIDWTIESYVVRMKTTEDVLVFRAFGMRGT